MEEGGCWPDGGVVDGRGFDMPQPTNKREARVDRRWEYLMGSSMARSILQDPAWHRGLGAMIAGEVPARASRHQPSHHTTPVPFAGLPLNHPTTRNPTKPTLSKRPYLRALLFLIRGFPSQHMRCADLGSRCAPPSDAVSGSQCFAGSGLATASAGFSFSRGWAFWCFFSAASEAADTTMMEMRRFWGSLGSLPSRGMVSA